MILTINMSDSLQTIFNRFCFYSHIRMIWVWIRLPMHPADDSREDGHSATDTRSATKQSAVIFDDVFFRA